jgi:glycosyltransferase involved in cell wall biosynthesis
MGVTSRVRFYQYLPRLEASGVHATVRPLWPTAYLEGLFAGRRASLALVAARYAARVARLVDVRRFDAVWLEAELWPYLPAGIERLLAHLGVPLVVDYDDAVFHKYDTHRSALVRALLSSKIDVVMRAARVVVAGNAYLAEHAARVGARRVEIVPTVVDLARYTPVDARTHARPRIGWIGSPTTAPYLKDIDEALQALDRDVDVRLVGVPASPLRTPAECRPWSEATEVDELRAFDIGIMPVPDAPWERGKCGYKLIQSMACGVPVVASPVGANRDIVTDKETGLHASTQAEWTRALRMLVDDAALRARLGAAGRARVEQRYALDVTAPRVIEIFRSLR